MKKILSVLFVLCVLFGVAGIVQAVDLNSAVVSAYNTAVSTSSATGRLVANTVAKVRIAKITITYDVTATTGTIKLYDNNVGSNSTLIYSVVLPVGTAIASNVIQESFDMGMPLPAHNGLLAIHEGGTGKNPIVVVQYW